MKKVISGIVAVLLIFALVGCSERNVEPPKDSTDVETTANSSFSESNTQKPPETEELKESESQSSEISSTEAVQTEKPLPSETTKESDKGSETEEPAKTEPTETKKETPKDTSSPKQEPKVTEPPKETAKPETQATEPPQTLVTNPPKQEETTAETKPEPTKQEPKETEPSFDINYWVEFAKQYAQSVGLVLNPEATSCWDNPIGAGAHCIYLERDIKDCLNCYCRDEEITDVWIWAVPTGNNCYDLMIGYA